MNWTWLAPWKRVPQEMLALSPMVLTISVRAATLIRQQEEEHVGPHLGESRRHRVFAQLVKEYPFTKWKDLALAIEVAIQRRGHA